MTNIHRSGPAPYRRPAGAPPPYTDRPLPERAPPPYTKVGVGTRFADFTAPPAYEELSRKQRALRFLTKPFPSIRKKIIIKHQKKKIMEGHKPRLKMERAERLKAAKENAKQQRKENKENVLKGLRTAKQIFSGRKAHLDNSKARMKSSPEEYKAKKKQLGKEYKANRRVYELSKKVIAKQNKANKKGIAEIYKLNKKTAAAKYKLGKKAVYNNHFKAASRLRAEISGRPARSRGRV